MSTYSAESLEEVQRFRDDFTTIIIKYVDQGNALAGKGAPAEMMPDATSGFNNIKETLYDKVLPVIDGFWRLGQKDIGHYATFAGLLLKRAATRNLNDYLANHTHLDPFAKEEILSVAKRLWSLTGLLMAGDADSINEIGEQQTHGNIEKVVAPGQTHYINGALKPILLCIDDEPIMPELIRDFLEKDYRIVTATSGKEALDIYKEVDIAFVISDYTMREMDGVETILAIRKLNPGVKAIILSGKPLDAEDNVTERKAGIEVYGKPFEIDWLKAIVKEQTGQ